VHQPPTANGRKRMCFVLTDSTGRELTVARRIEKSTSNGQSAKSHRFYANPDLGGGSFSDDKAVMAWIQQHFAPSLRVHGKNAPNQQHAKPQLLLAMDKLVGSDEALARWVRQPLLQEAGSCASKCEQGCRRAESGLHSGRRTKMQRGWRLQRRRALRPERPVATPANSRAVLRRH
jgi:hypothetical protein